MEDIAKSKGLSFSELIEEMQRIVYSGTKLNIDYCIVIIVIMFLVY